MSWLAWIKKNPDINGIYVICILCLLYMGQFLTKLNLSRPQIKVIYLHKHFHIFYFNKKNCAKIDRLIHVQGSGNVMAETNGLYPVWCNIYG